MELTKRSKHEFIKNGYLKIPRVIPKKKVDAALRAINCALGNLKTAPINGDSFMDMRESPAIMDLLLTTRLWPIAESLIGKGGLERPGMGTVTLGFPTKDAADPYKDKELHVDGFDWRRDIETFTMNVGIFLNDLPERFMGNLKLCPGSHYVVSEAIRRHGPQRSVVKDAAGSRDHRAEQIIAKSGDAVLFHFNVLHARAWNSSPNIRYAVFFRLRHVEHASRWERALTDLWLEWPGLRGLPPAARAH